MRRAVFWGVLAAAAGVLPLLSGVPETPPEPGIAVPCRVVSVHDGDTLTVEITLVAKVRLKDCWAAELKEPGGEASRASLESLAMGKAGVLHVPFGEAKSLGDVMSFERVVGEVWVGGRNLSEAQVEAGQATHQRLRR